MKTKLLEAAKDDIGILSQIDRECAEWAAEMRGALLVDAGDDFNTLLAFSEEGERTRIMREAAEQQLLHMGFTNLVFAFGRKGMTEVLLHATRCGQTWRLHMAVCNKDRYYFCPWAGVLPLDCSGMSLEEWPLSKPQDNTATSAFMLMDYALTGFFRLRGYTPKQLRHRTENIWFLDEALAA